MSQILSKILPIRMNIRLVIQVSFIRLYRYTLIIKKVHCPIVKVQSFFLTFVYIAFQGFLFSQSLVAIILANGIEGVLTALFFIIPINILNFASLISFLVVCWHRLAFASSYSLGTKKSLKTFTKKYMLVLALCVVSSLIYGFVYPLLLRSVVVINY